MQYEQARGQTAEMESSEEEEEIRDQENIISEEILSPCVYLSN